MLEVARKMCLLDRRCAGLVRRMCWLSKKMH